MPPLLLLLGQTADDLSCHDKSDDARHKRDRAGRSFTMGIYRLLIREHNQADERSGPFRDDSGGFRAVNTAVIVQNRVHCLRCDGIAKFIEQDHAQLSRFPGIEHQIRDECKSEYVECVGVTVVLQYRLNESCFQ